MGMLRAKVEAMGGTVADPPRLIPVVERTVRTVRERFSAGSVEWSADLKRIAELPRRTRPDLEQIAKTLTFVLKKPEGTQALREIQAWVLYDAAGLDGVLGIVSVGGGKTLCGMLAAMVVKNCKRAVLLLPPSLRPQFGRDWVEYGKHWKLPNLAGGSEFTVGRPVLHVVAYSELSHAKSTAMLEQIQPDLIISDEVHNLRNFSAARTKRFLRYLEAHPDTRFCGWSGTLTSSSIVDYAHLGAIALNMGSPLPLETSTVQEWSHALDADNEIPYEPGKLMTFCEPGEDVRSGFRRRLIDTHGVVASAQSDIGTALNFYERKPPQMPEALVNHLTLLRKPPKSGGWKRPDGEEFTDMLGVTNCARQLASGLYLRWRFPRGEPPEVIDVWFSRRQSWNREVRAQLSGAPAAHLDSYKLCENAAARWFDGGCPGCARGPMEDHAPKCHEAESHPLWPSYTFQEWRRVEDTVVHVTETVWESDWLLQDAAAWAAEAPGIIWTEHPDFGHRLAKLAGIPYFGAGKPASQAIILEKGDRSIVASADAHSMGLNLQVAFGRNLITSFPSSAALVEQLTGRTHRPGQPRDEVEVFYYLHTVELENAKETAMNRARYQHETQGTSQKMILGTWA